MRVSVEMAETLNRAIAPPPPPPQPKRNPIMNLLQNKRVGDDGVLRFKEAHLAIEAAAKKASLAWSKRARDVFTKAKAAVKTAFSHRGEANSAHEKARKMAIEKSKEAKLELQRAKLTLGRAGLLRGDLSLEAKTNFASRLGWESHLARVLTDWELVVPNPNGGTLPANLENGFACLVSMDCAHEATCLGTPVFARQGKATLRLQDVVYPSE